MECVGKGKGMTMSETITHIVSMNDQFLRLKAVQRHEVVYRWDTQVAL